MQELLNKHMIGTFVIEIAALTVALSIIGFIGMRLRAKKTGRAHSIRQYLLTASFALFLASILSLTLTPIGSSNSVTNPELYYPRFYVGWSWQQAWDPDCRHGSAPLLHHRVRAALLQCRHVYPLGLLYGGLLAVGPARYGAERLRAVELH